MRPSQNFVYRVERMPGRVPGGFEFLMKAGPVEVREAYATFNMGVGFAIYVDPKDAGRCVEIANGAGYDAWLAGSIRGGGQRKAVEIVPLGITFEGDTLQVR